MIIRKESNLNYKFTLKIVIGSICILTSLFLFLINSSFTGFVVNNSDKSSFNNYFSVLILFLGFTFLFLGRKDVLQERLEEMEFEHLSPSLQKEENKKQTRREKVHFGLRRLFGRRAVRRKEQVPRNYEKESDYQLDKYISKYRNPDLEKAEKNSDFRKYSKMRETIGQLNDFLKNPIPGTFEYGKKVNHTYDGEFQSNKRYIEKKEISNFLDSVDEICKKRGIPFNRDRYQKLLTEKLEGYYKKNSDFAKEEFLKYLTRNDERVNTQELWPKFEELMEIYNLSGRKEQGIPKSIEEAFGFYRENARTVPLQDVAEKHGTTFISSIPYMYNRRAFGRNPDLQEKFGAFAPDLSYKDFLERHIKGDLMISASAVNKDSSDAQFFSPIGIILGKGKIYDASPQDTESFNRNNSRISVYTTGKKNDSPLEERITEGLSRSPEWNEFIIGNYSPKGIYFIRDKLGISDRIPEHRRHGQGEKIDYQESPEEIIRNIAYIAEKHNLPLYEFKKGRGFVRISNL